MLVALYVVFPKGFFMALEVDTIPVQHVYEIVACTKDHKQSEELKA